MRFKGKVGEYLRESLEFLPMSYELATIKLDCDTGVGIDDLDQADSDPAAGRCITVNSVLLAGSMRSAVSSRPDANPARPEGNYECVLTQERFDDWVDRLRSAEAFAIDTETTSIDYMQAELVGISLCLEVGRSLLHSACPRLRGCARAARQGQACWRSLKPILEDPSVGKDRAEHQIRCARIHRRGYSLARHRRGHHARILRTQFHREPAQHGRAGEVTISNYETIHYEDIAGKGAKQKRFDEIALEEASDYAAEDADITLQPARGAECKGLKQDRRKTTLGIHRDRAAAGRRVARCRTTGRVDRREPCCETGREVDQQLQQIEQSIYARPGEVFNLGSPKQIQEILYDKLEMPVLRKTPKGQPSTAEDVLEELARDYEIPARILEHRSLNKLLVDLHRQTAPGNQFAYRAVHTSTSRRSPPPGRLSSTSPNLQNIPIRTARAGAFAKPSSPQEGARSWRSTIRRSNCASWRTCPPTKVCCTAFAQNLDVHRATAAEVFGAGLDDGDRQISGAPPRRSTSA